MNFEKQMFSSLFVCINTYHHMVENIKFEHYWRRSRAALCFLNCIWHQGKQVKKHIWVNYFCVHVKHARRSDLPQKLPAGPTNDLLLSPTQGPSIQVSANAISGLLDPLVLVKLSQLKPLLVLNNTECNFKQMITAGRPAVQSQMFFCFVYPQIF